MSKELLLHFELYPELNIGASVKVNYHGKLTHQNQLRFAREILDKLNNNNWVLKFKNLLIQFHDSIKPNK